MKIKKRLFISNIMMVVIPVVVAMATVILCLIGFMAMMFRGKTYEITNENELNTSRAFLLEGVENKLTEKGDTISQADLDSCRVFLDSNNMVAAIYEDGRELLRLGTEKLKNEEKLRDALAIIGGDGQASNETTEVYGKLMETQGKKFQILLYNGKFYVSEKVFKTRFFLLGLLMMFCILLVVYGTIRFLTGFVFRRIEEPLDILADGVRKIRDGNLNHRIAYETDDEFKPVCEDFNDMAGQLETSVTQIRKNEQSRKELLAGISHDLRSPLTSIKAYVEGLSDGIASTPEARASYLKTIRAKTEDIDHLVAKLFLFSKMDMGEYPNYPEKLDAGREIRDFVDASEEVYEKQGLHVETTARLDGAFINVDPTQFRSILSNLLDNSAKYKNKEQAAVLIGGGVTERQTIKLYVDDDGPGVPEEALNKLFDVFYRNDPSRTNPNKGSGLGLAIVAKALERMGGTIRALNREEGGLRMEIEIPLMKEEREAE